MGPDFLLPNLPNHTKITRRYRRRRRCRSASPATALAGRPVPTRPASARPQPMPPQNGPQMNPRGFHGVRIRTEFDADAESAIGFCGLPSKSPYFGSRFSTRMTRGWGFAAMPLRLAEGALHLRPAPDGAAWVVPRIQQKCPPLKWTQNRTPEGFMGSESAQNLTLMPNLRWDYVGHE